MAPRETNTDRNKAGVWRIIALASLLVGCRSTDLARTVEPVLEQRATAAGVPADPETLRVQVLMAEVRAGTGTAPTLTRSGYRVDAEYFYPASTIKLCAAVAAMQLLEDMRRAGAEVGLDTPMRIMPLLPGESVQERDETNPPRFDITPGHEIRALCLVSDNRAFNRLYDLVGHDELNRRMHDAGLSSVIINHRLSDPRAIPDQRATPAVELLTAGGVIEVPARRSETIRRTAGVPGLNVGRGFLKNGAVIEEGTDFSGRNRTSLRDLQDLLIMTARPDINLGQAAKIALCESDREFLLRAMSQYPGDSQNPRYPRETHPDGFAKLFLPGLLRVIPIERIRITNKVGQAYGFTTENAYIEDLGTGRSFFLTATIYTNADGVLNDNKYEYDTLAEPFMADLAEAVARRVWNLPAGL
ncbi:MAG: serine hydrolase [Phycisphaerae bacterium]|nr:serine hydrolase [Phycisphaerae bacterium]